MAPVTTAVQSQGVDYNHVTTLNLDLAPFENVVNVQGTTAVTNIFGHGGNEQFFVSSLANENLQTAPSADFLLGNLASIVGNLNLAAGAGNHTLMISNEGSVSGVASGLITNVPTSPTALTGTEIEVDGFAQARLITRLPQVPRASSPAASLTGPATGPSTSRSMASSNGRESSNSSGQLLRTISTLNTGLGTHNITVNLIGTASQGGLFVLNTQGPFANYPTYTNNSTVNASGSSLPLIIFGGQGTSNISGGSGDDIIFGHGGQVVYNNAQTSPSRSWATAVWATSTMASTSAVEHLRDCFVGCRHRHHQRSVPSTNFHSLALNGGDDSAQAHRPIPTSSSAREPVRSPPVLATTSSLAALVASASPAACRPCSSPPLPATRATRRSPVGPAPISSLAVQVQTPSPVGRPTVSSSAVLAKSSFQRVVWCTSTNHDARAGR